MIGLSLSFCVKDIAEGKVSESEVERLITGTCFRNELEFKEVLDHYAATIWRKLPEAVDIARRLYANGKIIQPRVLEQAPLNITNGHWRV